MIQDSTRRTMQCHYYFNKYNQIADENVRLLGAAVGMNVTKVQVIIALRKRDPMKFNNEMKSLYSKFYWRLFNEEYGSKIPPLEPATPKKDKDKSKD